MPPTRAEHSKTVEKRFEDALADAEKRLSSLAIVRGRKVNLKGLRGWIFEQTVRTCLEEELEKCGISTSVREQVPIGGRASVDLLISTAAVEVKAAGFFDDVGERYRGYRDLIEAKGWQYFYLTLGETYEPYAKIARSTFGKNRAFFLDQKGDWDRFLSEVMGIVKAKSKSLAKS